MQHRLRRQSGQYLSAVRQLGLLSDLDLAGSSRAAIILTAHADDAARARALAAGAVAVLPKPFQPDILLEAVEAALRRAADVSDDARGA